MPYVVEAYVELHLARLREVQSGKPLPKPVIHAKVDKLCARLAADAADKGAVVRLSRAWMALTTDINTEYAFTKSYDQLESPDFTAE